MRQTYRPEGERWFEWPLTPDSVGMSSGELIAELYETIGKLNHDRGWDLTMVAPAFRRRHHRQAGRLPAR